MFYAPFIIDCSQVVLNLECTLNFSQSINDIFLFTRFSNFLHPFQDLSVYSTLNVLQQYSTSDSRQFQSLLSRPIELRLIAEGCN